MWQRMWQMQVRCHGVDPLRYRGMPTGEYRRCSIRWLCHGDFRKLRVFPGIISKSLCYLNTCYLINSYFLHPRQNFFRQNKSLFSRKRENPNELTRLKQPCVFLTHDLFDDSYNLEIPSLEREEEKYIYLLKIWRHSPLKKKAVWEISRANVVVVIVLVLPVPSVFTAYFSPVGSRRALRGSKSVLGRMWRRDDLHMRPLRRLQCGLPHLLYEVVSASPELGATESSWRKRRSLLQRVHREPTAGRPTDRRTTDVWTTTEIVEYETKVNEWESVRETEGWGGG